MKHFLTALILTTSGTTHAACPDNSIAFMEIKEVLDFEENGKKSHICFLELASWEWYDLLSQTKKTAQLSPIEKCPIYELSNAEKTKITEVEVQYIYQVKNCHSKLGCRHECFPVARAVPSRP